jgi:hypothetical protein
MKKDSNVSDFDKNDRNFGFFDEKNTEIPSIITVPNEHAKKMRNAMIQKLSSQRGSVEMSGSIRRSTIKKE